MKKHFLTVSVIAILATGCMQNDVSHMAPGKYEKSERTTDAYGNAIEKKTLTDVQEDAYGKKRAVIETKTTKDPEGLFNKRTTDQTKQVIEEDKNY